MGRMKSNFRSIFLSVSAALIVLNIKAYSGGTLVNNGTLQIGNGVVNGSVSGNILNNTLLVFNPAVSNTFAAGITGPGQVLKSGPGALSLIASNNYSGGTTVNDGVLEFAGGWLSTDIGIVQVNSGAIQINGIISNAADTVTVTGGTLSGTGLILSAVNVQPAGTLAFSASIGTLTISNALALAGSAIMKIDRAAGQTSDKVVGLTAVTYGGVLVVTNLGGTLLAGDSFQLFSASSYAGTFSGIVPPAPGPGLAWDTNSLAVNGTLLIKVIPPPRFVSVALNGSGNLVFQGTNGPPGVGYTVLSSTNLAVSFALWVTNTTGSFDGTGAFSNSIPVDPTILNDFFLLCVP